MKWLKNFERLLEIQRNVVWPGNSALLLAYFTNNLMMFYHSFRCYGNGAKTILPRLFKDRTNKTTLWKTHCQSKKVKNQYAILTLKKLEQKVFMNTCQEGLGEKRILNPNLFQIFQYIYWFKVKYLFLQTNFDGGSPSITGFWETCWDVCHTIWWHAVNYKKEKSSL